MTICNEDCDEIFYSYLSDGASQTFLLKIPPHFICNRFKRHARLHEKRERERERDLLKYVVKTLD